MNSTFTPQGRLSVQYIISKSSLWNQMKRFISFGLLHLNYRAQRLLVFHVCVFSFCKIDFTKRAETKQQLSLYLRCPWVFLILISCVVMQLTLKLWFHCGCGNVKRWTSPLILPRWCADLRGSLSVQNVNRYLFSFKVHVEDIFCQTVQREDLSVLSHLHIWSDCCVCFFFFLLFLKWDFRFVMFRTWNNWSCISQSVDNLQYVFTTSASRGLVSPL